MSVIQNNPQLTMRTWYVSIIVLFILMSLLGVERGLSSKQQAAKRHAERIDPYKSESGKTQARWDEQKLQQSTPLKVKSGMYVDRVIELSLPKSSWVVDFYLWFRWDDKSISPGENFQIIDGEVIKKERVNKQIETAPFYELYRVKARMTKFFNTSRFPRDDHLLTIKIEDTKHQIYDLQYEPDTRGSAISSRVKLQGYEIYERKLVQKFHSYKTTRGERELDLTAQDTFSQLVYGIWIKRPGWGSFTKMFEGLFAAVAVSMLSFFIRTTTTNRISLGVGAFFAAVAATYVATRNLPNGGVLTLTDVITGIAMLTIFLVIWHTIIATRLFELHQDDRLVHHFDMVGFIIFSVGYVAVNTALVLAASISV